MTRINSSITPGERDTTKMLVTLGAVIGALYFGSEVFIPIALAILLSFVLAPAVRKLHGLGLGRVFPVLTVTVLAFTVIFGAVVVMGTQLKELASELPRYEGTITRKMTALRAATNNGIVDHLETAFARLSRSETRTAPAAATPNQDSAPMPREPVAAPAASARQPTLVEIWQQPPSSLDTIRSLAEPTIHPLATSGIVVIFVIFILLQREDLRNRLIRLFGASDLQRTTAAIDDGAKRLSRYFITQSCINALSGLVIGLAAWAIGIPSPVLWGLLFGLMRFVPYIGPIIGGVLPVAFAAAVDTGWTMALWMAGIALVTELLVGQVLEPLLYGHNTGLSPVAVIVAATFWTALWGPVGLLLATPLTVCLVVIGRHVDQLNFFDVLLGDKPPLTAAETFYQRMLANDPAEVSEQADECLKTMSPLSYYDTVMLPGLLLAQADATAERLDVERQTQIRDATLAVIAKLEHVDDRSTGRGFWQRLRHPRLEPQPAAVVDTLGIAAGWRREGAILCIGGRGPLDDCGAAMLAQILQKRGLGARSASFEMLARANIDGLDAKSARLICLSCLDGSSSDYLHFALRRVRRRSPRARVLIGAWWLQITEATELQADGSRAMPEPVAPTIVDATRFCLAAASALNEDELTAHQETVPEGELSEAL